MQSQKRSLKPSKTQWKSDIALINSTGIPHRLAIFGASASNQVRLQKVAPACETAACAPRRPCRCPVNGRRQRLAPVRTLRLGAQICATDAACEGLNLQRLGAQINVDLPWNPSRLEQRKGRVQRIGQVRDDVHILSLRYAGTVEDQVYATLSARFGDIFSVLGQLPDGFEDQWIDAVLRDRDAVKNFSQRVEKERPPMELRYMRDVADDRGLDWEYTEKVLSSRDLDEWMRQGW